MIRPRERFADVIIIPWPLQALVRGREADRQTDRQTYGESLITTIPLVACRGALCCCHAECVSQRDVTEHHNQSVEFIHVVYNKSRKAESFIISRSDHHEKGMIL